MMADYQKTEHVKEEVVDCGFVEYDSQDVYQLCMASLCATRTTHTLNDVALKQYYMHILTEMQLEGGVVLQSPRVCWECVSHLKRLVRFREQVQDSYRLLQPMLSMCNKEDAAECLQTSVSRPERLKACFAFSIDIAPQDDDAQVMTVTTHDDDDAGASECLDTNIERHFAVPEETVATIKEEEEASFCDEDDSILICVTEDLVESPQICDCQGNVNNEQSEEPDAHTRTEVMNDIKTINTQNSSNKSTGDVNTAFVCDYCCKRFTSKAALERHIATYNIYPHNNKIVPSPCEDCAVVLCSDDQCSECPNKHILLQHISMMTKITKVLYQSKVCHKSFSFKRSLLRYRSTPTGKNLYQCEVCHKSFTFKQNLLRHKRIHTGEKPYQCEVCFKLFLRKNHLMDHSRIHTGEKPFQCEVCHKSFSLKENLLRHKITHTGEELYQCQVCHKSFSFKHNLVRHKRTHTGAKPYQCKMCDKAFSQKGHLVRHIKIHTGEKLYQCKVCNKSFSLKHHLMYHLRTHIGVKPFQCEVCHKTFSNKSNLANHKKIHTDETLFQCKICNKSFSLKKCLVDHFKTHTDHTPFQCEVCHKSFSLKGSLRAHKRSHTDEKPYPCQVCHKSFSVKGALVRHIRTHSHLR